MKKFTHRFAFVCFFALLTLLPRTAHALSKKEAEKAGALLFRNKGCAHCHGMAAEGTRKGPSLTNIRKTWQPAQIADQVQNGGERMPAFKDSISEDELSKLIAFLRAKHRPAIPPPPVYAPLVNPAQ